MKFIKRIFATLPQQIKYPLMRFLIRTPELPKNIEFSLAHTTDDRNQAFSLLYKNYVADGLMTLNESRLRITKYHNLPTSHILIAKCGNQVIATMTIICDNPIGLPADEITDLSELRKFKIAEISALAVDRAYKGKLFLHLTKFMYQYCLNVLDLDYIIATLTTDTKSYEIYEAIFLFHPLPYKPNANYNLYLRPIIAEALHIKAAMNLYKKYYEHKSKKRNLYLFFLP